MSSIKSFDDFKMEMIIPQFLSTQDLIFAVSEGERARCMLKPSAEFAGSYVAEVWAYDPDTGKYEVEGILHVENDGPEMQILSEGTLTELKAAMHAALPDKIYDAMEIVEAPDATPASFETDGKLTVDFSDRVGGPVH